MEQVSLSNIELYYSTQISGNEIKFAEDEFKHITKVMRKGIGDELFVCDGKGSIINGNIREIKTNSIRIEQINRYESKNTLHNITFCIPRLKSADRFEFALEKCVELGITNFVVFESHRTIAKGNKIKRWEKILMSAMKQSLRSWKPKIEYCRNIKDILKFDGNHFCFEQNSQVQFEKVLEGLFRKREMTYFYFGPEGGLTESEIALFDIDKRLNLTQNRLRSETAVSTTAALIAINAKY